MASDAPRPDPGRTRDPPEASRVLELVGRLQREIVAAGSDVARVMELVARQAAELTRAEGAVVEIREGDEMVYRAAVGTAAPHLGLRLDVHASLSGRATLKGEALLSRDTEEDPRVDREATRRIGVRSMALVPLQAGGGTLGVLKVLSPEPGRFGEPQVESLQLLAGLMAASILAADEHRRIQRLTSRLQAVFDAAPLPIFAVDPEERVTLWSPSAVRLYGWSEEEVIGRPLPVVAEGAEVEHRRALEAVLSGAGAQVWETNHRTRGGGTVPVAVSAAPKKNEDGGVTGAAFFARDVSGERELQRRLVRAQRLEAVGRLAGGIAHDFNNMLTAITGFSRLLLDDPDLSEDHRASVREIVGAAGRSAYITQQLLAYSRRQVLEPRVLDLNEIVREMRGVGQHLMGKSIRLEVRLSAEPCRVRADKGQLEQVLLNLLANAREAIAPEPGWVRVETRKVPASEAPDAGLEGPQVVLVVQDSGAGMAPEVVAQIFEPFYTTKQLTEGTGLGLATVEGVVHQSGGRIHVDSVPGEGTTFRIHLPAATEGEGSRREGARADPPEPPTMRILVVDDEDTLRVLMGRILERAGHEVVLAATPGEALERVEETRVDAVISDVVMPEMTGFRLLDILRERRPDLPCLFVSGYIEDELEREAVGEGTVFLHKPFEPDDLLAALARVV